MLKSRLIHPEIVAALGRAGHGSRILIADGNYPCATTLGPHSRPVYLNLAPGTVSCTEVLEVLLDAVPLEAAHVMQYATDGPHALPADPEIWSEFAALLASAGYGFALESYERFEFYRQAAAPQVALAIATGEQRIYANLLLTIGVRQAG